MGTNSAGRLSPRANRVLASAIEIAAPGDRVTTGSLLAALTDEPAGSAALVLAAHGVDVDVVLAGIAALDVVPSHADGKPKLTPLLSRTIASASAYAAKSTVERGGRITTGHLLLGLLDEPDSVAAMTLAVLGARVKDVRSDVARFADVRRFDDWQTEPQILAMTEAIELPYPPERVWALIEAPEHAPLTDSSVIGGSRHRTDDGRELHELFYRPGSEVERVVIEVDVEVPGRRVRTRRVEPEPDERLGWTEEVSPLKGGALFRVEPSLDIVNLPRRRARLTQRLVRDRALDYLRRVNAALEAGWTPASIAGGDGSQ